MKSNTAITPFEKLTEENFKSIQKDETKNLHGGWFHGHRHGGWHGGGRRTGILIFYTDY